MMTGRVLLVGAAVLLCRLVLAADAVAPRAPDAPPALSIVRQDSPETLPGIPHRDVPRWSVAHALPGGPTLRLQPDALRLSHPLWSRRDYILVPTAPAPAGAGRCVYVRYLARDPSLA